MPFLKLNALPEIRFAHRFCAESYHGRIPANARCIEISAITAGGFCVTRDGKRYDAEAGDLICNFYKSPMAVDTDAYHCHHTVCFWVECEPIQGQRLPPVVLHAPERFERCLRLIDEIIHSFALRPAHTWKTGGLFLQLRGELELCCGAQASVAAPGESPYARQAKRYIFEHISEPIKQSEIAAQLGITSEYLCNVFKKSEHTSVMRFINETKLTQIRSMMESKGIPLHQAALQYGFADPNYVSRLYKKYYGRALTEEVKKT